MAEDDELPTDIGGAIAYIKKHLIAIIMGTTALGGGGTGVAFSDTIYNAVIENIATGLEANHNIKPLPPGLDAELKTDSIKIAVLDSIDEVLMNNLSYQKGFNVNVSMSKMVDTIVDGIPMKLNTETNTKWITWDGYTYLAVNEGNGNWAIFLFQWQLPKGADNHYSIDPMYFRLN